MSTGNDYIDNERHRKPARKVQGDPRPTKARRKHPPKPHPAYGGNQSVPFRKRYQTKAAEYSQFADNAAGATSDDAIYGNGRSEPMPSEIAYCLLANAMRMAVRDVKERDSEIVRLCRKAHGNEVANALYKLLQTI
jgi:hypothetical protein